MKQIAVSIHAIQEFKPEIIKNLEGLDYIHVDVMDGKFVSNKNNNLNVFTIIKETYDIPIIAHLMVTNPFKYIKKIINFIDFFVFHFEINYSINKIIKEVRKNNKKVGLAINPETSVYEILPYLDKIDLVLVMSVNPGWSGQRFIPQTVKKVDQLAEFKNIHNFFIDIDGGINLTNARLLKNTDILTSSSFILENENPNRTIKFLRESDENI